jgi:hypothetical protein
MKRDTIRQLSELVLVCAGGLAFPLAQAAGFYLFRGLTPVSGPGDLLYTGKVNPNSVHWADSRRERGLCLGSGKGH